ncbi:MAG: transglycosylase domain-containing protein [Terriglobales bacterium]
MRVRITTRGLAGWLARPLGRTVVVLVFAAFVAGGVAFIHYYNVYAAVIDARLSSPIFHPSSLVFAAPKVITLGEELTPAQATDWLLAAGYATDETSPVGTYLLAGDTLRITPGPEAYHAVIPVQVQFQNGAVSSIVDLQNQQAMDQCALEPELLTTLFNQKRVKRRIVRYQDLPPMLIQAVLDIEDKDYFHEGAVNWERVPVAFYRDLRAGRKEQGASTITMQVARNIFDLGFQKTAKRKLEETLVAMELNQRLTKAQIFELYANQIYMGQRGSYSIHGFGEAADAYFGKSVKQLNLPECALLAGIIHAPNGDSPYRHPRRARERRNEVLRAIERAGAITAAQMRTAERKPLELTSANNEASDAPYFTDLVRDRLSDAASNRDLSTESYRIYTTLNPELQAAAAAAVSEGMVGVDKELAALRRRRHHGRKSNRPEEKAQVALVALDPQTGAVLALVGGRNFAFSQLNHALSERPTGSVFKPFVYAAALETGLLPNLPAITQSSILNDEPTVFPGGYAPRNFENKYYGPVTLRVALADSLNNATIALAEEVGLQAVTDLAHSAGILNAQPTPSEAIGAYDSTPLQIAGAYTIFDNAGVREQPRLIDSVQNAAGKVILQHAPQPVQVLDPRIAFLTTNLMESVLQFGSGVRARAMGFDAPAAGKTGTEHDAWFAGFTDKLLCVVWVGLDNYHDLDIEGAHAALPIWADFMKAALLLPAYANPQPFVPPPGVIAVKVDTLSHQVATPLTPPNLVQVNYYLDDTQPTEMDHLYPSPLMPRAIAAQQQQELHRLDLAPPPVAPPPVAARLAPLPAAGRAPAPPTAKLTATAPGKKKKRGFFGRLLHAIVGGSGGGKKGGG